MAYVLAVPVNQHVVATIEARPVDCRVDALSAAVPESDWTRLSAGVGAKGPRPTEASLQQVPTLESVGPTTPQIQPDSPAPPLPGAVRQPTPC